jgi:hypothetical protein
MSIWPKDNPAALKAFYGDPGRDEVASQLVSVKPPFQMYYEGKPIDHIPFHKKAASALKAALDEIWEHCGKEQALIERFGLHRYDGAYNKRLVRGSSSKWSNHAFGAAIDIDAEDNPMGRGRGTMPDFAVRAFKRQGARWGGDYHSRKDPMHFEFCDNGEHSVESRAPVPIAAPQVDAHDRHEGPVEIPKPLPASKIAGASIVSIGGAVAAIGDQLDTATDGLSKVKDAVGSVHEVAHTFGILDILARASHSVTFWAALLMIAGAIAVIYWRWKDHGRGAVQEMDE